MNKVLGIQTQIARVVPPSRHGTIEAAPPSPRHRQCLVTERRTELPFLVDEAGGEVDTPRAIAGGAMDVVDLNAGRAGRPAKIRLPGRIGSTASSVNGQSERVIGHMGPALAPRFGIGPLMDVPGQPGRTIG
jgi:hypothetical protein